MDSILRGPRRWLLVMEFAKMNAMQKWMHSSSQRMGPVTGVRNYEWPCVPSCFALYCMWHLHGRMEMKGDKSACRANSSQGRVLEAVRNMQREWSARSHIGCGRCYMV